MSGKFSINKINCELYSSIYLKKEGKVKPFELDNLKFFCTEEDVKITKCNVYKEISLKNLYAERLDLMDLMDLNFYYLNEKNQVIPYKDLEDYCGKDFISKIKCEISKNQYLNGKGDGDTKEYFDMLGNRYLYCEDNGKILCDIYKGIYLDKKEQVTPYELLSLSKFCTKEDVSAIKCDVARELILNMKFSAYDIQVPYPEHPELITNLVDARFINYKTFCGDDILKSEKYVHCNFARNSYIESEGKKDSEVLKFCIEEEDSLSTSGVDILVDL